MKENSCQRSLLMNIRKFHSKSCNKSWDGNMFAGYLSNIATGVSVGRCPHKKHDLHHGNMQITSSRNREQEALNGTSALMSRGLGASWLRPPGQNYATIASEPTEIRPSTLERCSRSLTNILLFVACKAQSFRSWHPRTQTFHQEPPVQLQHLHGKLMFLLCRYRAPGGNLSVAGL